MRLINFALLVQLLVFCPLVFAGADVAGRPSADRPPAPTAKPLPDDSDFSLPPAPHSVPLEHPPSDNVRILLRGLAFEGNTAFTDAQLQALATPYLNRPVSLSDLEALRLLITKHYISNGYINSGAVIPEQTFKHGIIRFKVTEGVLSAINVSGTERLHPDYVSDRLRWGIKKPLNFNTLQERFQLLLSDPLIERMKGQLIPGQHSGESIFNVEVVRKRPYQVNLTFDNHRPPSVGAEQGTLSGWLRNITGFGDEINWDVIYSEGSVAGGGGVVLPLTAYDTRFHFDFSLSQTTAIQIADKNIKSHYNGYNFALSQPLYQSLQHQLSFRSGLSIRQNQIYFADAKTSFSDEGDDKGRSQSTAIRSTLDYSYRGQRQALAFRSTVSVGIHALGASWMDKMLIYPGLEINMRDSDFVSWLNQLQYVQQISDGGSQILFNGAVQLSNDRLMSLERFALGGSGGVRGYRENELVRDEGYLLSLEFRYPLFDHQDDHFPGKLTAATFMDYGSAWNKHDDQSPKRTLHSLGVGLIWDPLKRVHAEIYYAHALQLSPAHPSPDLQDKGIHFSLNLAAF